MSILHELLLLNALIKYNTQTIHLVLRLHSISKQSPTTAIIWFWSTKPICKHWRFDFSHSHRHHSDCFNALDTRKQIKIIKQMKSKKCRLNSSVFDEWKIQDEIGVKKHNAECDWANVRPFDQSTIYTAAKSTQESLCICITVICWNTLECMARFRYTVVQFPR